MRCSINPPQCSWDYSRPPFTDLCPSMFANDDFFPNDTSHGMIDLSGRGKSTSSSPTQHAACLFLPKESSVCSMSGPGIFNSANGIAAERRSNLQCRRPQDQWHKLRVQRSYLERNSKLLHPLQVGTNLPCVFLLHVPARCYILPREPELTVTLLHRFRTASTPPPHRCRTASAPLAHRFRAASTKMLMGWNICRK